jgi:hypothetical protein
MGLRSIFHREQPVAPEVVAHRVESFRMQEAKLQKRRAERTAAIRFAATLGVVSEPMTPRAQIAAEVAALRKRRKRP